MPRRTVAPAKEQAGDYKWEIFLSYPRQGPVGQWVRELFHPLLKGYMEEQRPQARVFFDSAMENGGCLTEKLADGLRHSRLLVAVWSARYFTRPWCDAEWKSMLAREEQMGLGRDHRPGLIYPVVYCDGENFPERAKETLHNRDLKRFAALGSGCQGQMLHTEFKQELIAICEDLDRWLKMAPVWQQGWPVLPPDPAAGALLPNPFSVEVL